MSNCASFRLLGAALALFVIIGLSGEAFALSDSATTDSPIEVLKGGDRVPMAHAFVGYGANWREAGAEAFAAAERRFKGGFEVVGVQRNVMAGLVLPGMRYRVIIWAVPVE